MYNRIRAVRYAKKWALSRNPAYYDYSDIGGDCTNFASQVLRAGGCDMNFTPTFGWYYRNADDKSPSWTGVNEFYNFLKTNRETGPKAFEIPVSLVLPGDIAQLDFDGNGKYEHTPVILKTGKHTPETIKIAAHTKDSYMRPLSSYNYKKIRYLHVFC